MSSKPRSARDALATALDNHRRLQAELLAMPLHTLTTAELLALLDLVRDFDRALAALQQRAIGLLAARTLPAQRVGGSLAGVLSRRLRISEAEAARRISTALRAAS